MQLKILTYVSMCIHIFLYKNMQQMIYIINRKPANNNFSVG